MISYNDAAPLDDGANYSLQSHRKRRPALACEQCRRRKVKCNRNSPCGPCNKAKIRGCRYVQDNRTELKSAPFNPDDTHFSVFEQDSTRTYTSAPLPTPVSTTTPSYARPSISSSSDTVLLSPENFPLHDLVNIDPILSPNIATLEIQPVPSGLGDQTADDSSGIVPCDLRTLVEVNGSKQAYLEELFPITKPGAWGVFYKNRFHGQSSWMNYLLDHSETFRSTHIPTQEDFRNAQTAFAECKTIGREIKMREYQAAPFSGSVRDLVPNRALSDQLVQAYLRTLQTVFGIVYVPSFREEYKTFWTNPLAVDKSFGIRLLLVMCIGSTFCEGSISRATTVQWIQVASTWLTLLKEKARLNLDTLRIQCLYLLAGQVKAVEGDLAWLSTGSLVRSAIQMGMHIDPEHCPGPISHAEAESRRRLWAAILELEVQSSMDCGTVPFIDCTDYNCAPPLNVDDASLQSNESAKSGVKPKPIDEPTQSSIQVLLMKTMSVRLKIARHLNSLHSDASYETTLALDTQLVLVMKECSAHLHSYRMSSMPPAAFQTKLFHLMIDRFLLSLHHPFAVTGNPMHYYSRKSCLDASLAVLSYWASPNDDDFYRLRLSGTGTFRDVYTQIAFYLCRELHDQAKSDQPFGRNYVSAWRGMRDGVESFLELAEARLGEHERNVNFHVIVSCLLARADAVQAGTPAEQEIAQALSDSLKTCLRILKPRSQSLINFDDTWSDLPDLDMVDFQ